MPPNNVTLLENNIKAHYFEYIERYINVVYGKDDNLRIINDNFLLTPNEKVQGIRRFCNKLRLIKNDLILNHIILLSEEEDHEWIRQIRASIIYIYIF